jgi:hypothetical protein
MSTTTYNKVFTRDIARIAVAQVYTSGTDTYSSYVPIDFKELQYTKNITEADLNTQVDTGQTFKLNSRIEQIFALTGITDIQLAGSTFDPGQAFLVSKMHNVGYSGVFHFQLVINPGTTSSTVTTWDWNATIKVDPFGGPEQEGSTFKCEMHVVPRVEGNFGVTIATGVTKSGISWLALKPDQLIS